MRLETTNSGMVAATAVVRYCARSLTIVLIVVLMCPMPSAAYADGGVSLVQVWAGSQGVDDVWPGPVDGYNLSLEFDKNVSYANQQDDAFVSDNLAKVYVVDGSGRRLDSIVTAGASGPDDKTVIYLRATEWLVPLAKYTVVAEAGIRAKNGEDATAVEYRSTFTTSADCANGLTVYQNVALCVVAAAAMLGAVAAFLRRRRAR